MNRNSFLYSLYRHSRVLPVVYWWYRELEKRYVSRRRGLAFDKLNNVETEDGFGPLNLGLSPDVAAHSSAYNAIDPARFKRVLTTIKMDPTSFCFIDVGSGKGRALFMAQQYGFRRILGVELSTKVHKIAEKNLERYRAGLGRDPQIELHNCDVLALELPHQPTVVLMNNPFDAAIMSRFAAKMDQSLTQNPRDFFLIYVRPRAEEALASSKRLQKLFEDRSRDNFIVYRSNCGSENHRTYP